jgi:hypothetical protein
MRCIRMVRDALGWLAAIVLAALLLGGVAALVSWVR